MMKRTTVVGALVFGIGLTYAAWFASYVPQPTRIVTEAGERFEEPQGIDRIFAWGSEVGTRFASGIVFMVVGGLVARRGNAATEAEVADDGTEGHGLPRTPEALLTYFESTLEGLDAAALPDGAAELADTIDALLNDAVPAFLDHRARMIDQLGLERFAEMIGHFASMERGAARAWSAITDEAWEEARPSLARAKQAIAAARESFGQPGRRVS